MTGQRGRPKSAATLERERIEELLRTRPSHIPLKTDAEKTAILNWLSHLEKIRTEILKDHKTSATIPDEHAYVMASLGHEGFLGNEQTVLKKDEDYQRKSQENREDGGEAVRSEADRRAHELCTKNRILLESMKPFGRLSLSDVASKIIRDWAAVHPDSLVKGESKGLKERGLAGDPPDTKTIKNYIRKASPFLEQRVGKTSLRKK